MYFILQIRTYGKSSSNALYALNIQDIFLCHGHTFTRKSCPLRRATQGNFHEMEWGVAIAWQL